MMKLNKLGVKNGLYANIAAKAKQNKKSGAKPKAPSKAMLAQEKKIEAKAKKK
jgi:hypothetical protein